MNAYLASVLLVAMASELEATVEKPADETAEVHGRSRTFVMIGARPYFGVDASGQGSLVERRFVPIVQDVFLDGKPGIDGVTIVLDGWLGLDAGERFYGTRTPADVTEGFIRWDQKDYSLRAGRVFLFGDTGRGLRVDGGQLLIHPRAAIGDARFSFDAFAGVPVRPLFGEEPLLHDRPEALRDPLLLAQKGADWSRAGDAAAGASAGFTYGHVLETKLGYLHQVELAEIQRETIVSKLRFALDPRLALVGFGAYDLHAKGLEDAELEVESFVFQDLRVAVFGRARQPALLLPATSIFSVFGSETHQETGLESDLFLARRMRLSLSGEVRRTQASGGGESAIGYRAFSELKSELPFVRGSRGALSYERLADGWFGRYDYLRLSAEVPLARFLSASADGGAFLIRAREAGIDASERLALRGGVSASIFNDSAWRAVLAVRATRTPELVDEIAVIGRIEWNVDRAF
jgi:hypothetical protein